MISVITPTYQNLPDLREAIASLNAQTFKDWQHVIVADGPDPVLRHEMRTRGYRGAGKKVFIELGRNWHGFLGGDHAAQPPDRPGARGGRGSRGAEVALVGTHLAAGEYITYLDADCLYRADHLELCAKTLEATGADFVWTQMQRFLDGRPWDIVGSGNVAYAQIDGNVVVHKAELLRHANWRWGGDADWDVIGRWHASGARAEFIPQATVFWNHPSGDI
ncbi:MAG TPA: glycosyltransferase [Streptosporangiaceae bacterium]